jgi:hypothetical protein
MSRQFEDLSWHDAVILAIEIDRRRPGVADEVIFTILWPDDRRSRIAFLECYAMDARLHFGVVARESVRSVTESEDTAELQLIRGKWRTLGVELSALKSFTIETNSTASSITVSAKSWTERFDE